jgi:hypothetical protein
VVCGVKVSCGPGALAHGVSPELPQTPQQWYQSLVRLGGGAGVDPGIGSTIVGGNSHLEENVGFQM